MNASEQAPWWKGACIYSVYPRSFQDSTGSGAGDLAGLRERLPYIAKLGVDAVWICPFYPSPLEDGGYDISDYCNVDPRFGTLEDFRAVVSEAHRLGLRVIIDQVYSHTSRQHPWFAESYGSKQDPKSDWYVWADPKADGSPPNNWQSALGGGPAWTREAQRQQYYLHNWHRTQPDLNFHLPAVQDAILDVARFWMDLGIDGMRLDVANYYFHDPELRDNPPDTNPDRAHPWFGPHGMQQHHFERSRPETVGFLRRLREVADAHDVVLLGELFTTQGLRRFEEYAGAEGPLHTAYHFDFLEERGDAAHFREVLGGATKVGGLPTWNFSNHDRPRVVSRWRRDGDAGDPWRKDRAEAYLTLLLSLPGNVCLYQGEELGLPEAELTFEELQDPLGKSLWPRHHGRDGCRTPMPWDGDASNLGFSEAVKCWLPPSPKHGPLAVKAQEADADSTLHHLRRLVAARKAHAGLRAAECEATELPGFPSLLMLRRGRGDDALQLLLNLSDEALHVPLPETLAARAATEQVPDLPRKAQLLRDSGAIDLPPWGYAFL